MFKNYSVNYHNSYLIVYLFFVFPIIYCEVPLAAILSLQLSNYLDYRLSQYHIYNLLTNDRNILLARLFNYLYTSHNLCVL